MTTVLCCGVFDVLHAGHVQLLEQARSLGSVLVVGINSDASAAALGKGLGRPYNTAEDRAAVLRALRCVDRVVIFHSLTPRGLISGLRPAFYVKGGDYTADALPEAAAVHEVGGTIAILPLLEGRSTTVTLRRMGVE